MKGLECLYGLVGLKGVCEEENTCLYVNDLSGVTLRSFAKVADEEAFTAKAKFEALRKEAAIQLYSDFFTELSKHTKVKDSIYQKIEGSFDTQSVIESNDSYYKLIVSKNCYEETITPCLDFVSIYAISDVEIELTIKNGTSERTENIELFEGENMIKINEVGDRIEASFSSSDLVFASTKKSYCGCDTCTCNSCFYVQRKKSEDGINYSVDNASPFKYCVTCKCNKADILCCYGESLAIPYRYKIASLLFEERINSDSTDSFIRNGRDKAEKMITSIMGGEDPETGFFKPYEKAKYWSSLRQVIINNELPNSPCIECTGSRFVETTP